MKLERKWNKNKIQERQSAKDSSSRTSNSDRKIPQRERLETKGECDFIKILSVTVQSGSMVVLEIIFIIYSFGPLEYNFINSKRIIRVT